MKLNKKDDNIFSITKEKREGIKNVAAGANPMVMRRGMQKAIDTAVEAYQYWMNNKDTENWPVFNWQ